MSEHLHSHAEPHSCSLSEHSLQFELRSTAPSFPFLFPSTPNHHVPAPTLNLSSNPPLFCGSLPKVHPPPPPPPSFPPLSFLCPTLLPGSAHDNSFIPHSIFFGKDLRERCLWILRLFLCFKTLFCFVFLENVKHLLPFPDTFPLFSVTSSARSHDVSFCNSLKCSSEKCEHCGKRFILNKQKRGAWLLESPDVVPADRRNGKT